MSVKTVIVCDYCGSPLGEIGFKVDTFDGLLIKRFDPSPGGIYDYDKHACGAECLHKALSKVLQEQYAVTSC